MKREKLEDLIMNLLDGTDVGEDLAALEHELETNPDAQALFFDHIRLEAALTPSAAGSAAEVIPMNLLIKRQRHRSLMIAAISSAAALALVGFVLLFLALPGHPPASFTTSPQTEFTLTHATDHEVTSSANTVLEIGSRLQIQRGSIELNFNSGVRGIIRGPADLTLTESGRITLAHGTAWFEVPEKAVGFQVDTPDFLLTDLGTEFGIVSTSMDGDQVHVFTGKVDLVQHHDDGHHSPLSLIAGQARQAMPTGSWREIELSRDPFFTQLPDWHPAPPYLYWSFDQADGDQFPVGGTHPLAADILSERGFSGEGPVAVQGSIENAMKFDESNDHIKTDWAGISGAKSRSVAFWIRLPDSIDSSYNSSLISWGTPSPELSKVWSVRATKSESVIREEDHGKTLLQVWFSKSWVNGTTDLADGKWHHVAACFRGASDSNGHPTVDLYVDGKPETTHYGSEIGEAPPINTDITSASAIPLVIGRSKTHPGTSCNATLDELFVFDGYADETIIKLLADPKKRQLP